MTDTTAKIRAKGLDATGVTEEIASTLYANKGKRIMAIVELHAVERHEKADGSRRVDLVVEQVEPATEDNVAEHLRELTRTMYQNRAIAEGQLSIDDSLTPKLSDALAAGAQHRPHPFLPVLSGEDAADDNGICDVCGLVNNVGVHFTEFTDPFETPTTDTPTDTPTDDQGTETLADPDDPDIEPTLDQGAAEPVLATTEETR